MSELTIGEVANEIAGGDLPLDEREVRANRLITKLMMQQDASHKDTLAGFEATVANQLLGYSSDHPLYLFLKELRGDILEAITGSRKLTCDGCDSNLCEYKGDFYNTNGDCLRDK